MLHRRSIYSAAADFGRRLKAVLPCLLCRLQEVLAVLEARAKIDAERATRNNMAAVNVRNKVRPARTPVLPLAQLGCLLTELAGTDVRPNTTSPDNRFAAAGCQLPERLQGCVSDARRRHARR